MLKKFVLPVAIALAASALVLTAVLYIADMSTPPEDIASEYIKACMYQDVDAMVRYSSDYNKAALNGGSMPDDKHLKNKLNTIYSEAQSIYLNDEITFGVISSTEIKSDHAEYEDVYVNYSRLADFGKITAVQRVELNVYVNGNRQQTNRCYLVKENGYWRFAYQF